MAVVAFIIGAILGSFACCQAWRIKLNDKSKRSHCLNCGARLKWYENLPIISWLGLRGRCRYCHKKIGAWELLSELMMGVVGMVFAIWVFEHWKNESWILLSIREWSGVVSVLFWLMMCVLAVLLVAWMIIFIYDARWQEMPTKLLTFCVVCAIIWVILKQWSLLAVGKFSGEEILNLGGALLVLPVMYFFLYKVGKEQWVGGGDWLLALSIALVLGNFWLAFVVLFVANLLGSVVGMAILLKKGLGGGRKLKMAFGPFLIAAFWVVFVAQDVILAWTSW